MSAIKIARQAYRRAPQSTLADFTDNVFQRMQGVAAYGEIQPLVQLLPAAVGQYRNLLVAARNRGRSEIMAKNLGQAALIQQLDRLANELDHLAAGNAQLIVDAGFTVVQPTSARYTGTLPAPVILRASSTGKKGEIRIAVDDQVPSGTVVTHAMEYSLNRESGWQNGTYHTHRNFVAEGLPRAEELWLRLKSLGHGNNRSTWSDPVVVAVL